MKLEPDCYPCFVRQALHTCKIASGDSDAHSTALKKILKYLSEADDNLSPPELASEVYSIISKECDNPDPYDAIKASSTTLAKSLLKKQESSLASSSNPFVTAARLAIAGNIIDYGTGHRADSEAVQESLTNALQVEYLEAPLQRLQQRCKEAKNILYLADNAGELVFDINFIKHISTDKITLAVRGGNIINDATRNDLKPSGASENLRVIDGGVPLPGTSLRFCSDFFKKVFHEADLIISKGQGNLETLIDENAPIFFLLKVKCGVVAKKLGKPLGTLCAFEKSELV